MIYLLPFEPVSREWSLSLTLTNLRLYFCPLVLYHEKFVVMGEVLSLLRSPASVCFEHSAILELPQNVWLFSRGTNADSESAEAQPLSNMQYYLKTPWCVVIIPSSLYYSTTVTRSQICIRYTVYLSVLYGFEMIFQRFEKTASYNYSRLVLCSDRQTGQLDRAPQVGWG